MWGALAAVLAAAGLLLALIRMRARRRGRERLAEALNSDGLKPGRVYEAVHEGTPYEYVYRPATRNSPSSFSIRLPCASRGEFKVTRESRLDALFKRLGVSVELQTGDRNFDRELYIQTDSVEFTRAYFADYDKREALQKIIQSGCRSVTHDGAVIETVIRPFSPGSDEAAALIGETVNRLRVLTEDLPGDYHEPRMLGLPAWKVRRALVFSVAGASLGGGLAAMLYGLYAFRPLDLDTVLKASLDYSLPLLALFVFAAMMMLKGRSSSHRELIRAVVLAVPGFPLIGFGGAVVLNGYLDTSTVTYHHALVTGARKNRAKNSTDYYLLVRSWRRGHTTEKLAVADSIYERAKLGRSVLVVGTHRGYYGFEWLASCRLNNPKRP